MAGGWGGAIADEITKRGGETKGVGAVRRGLRAASNRTERTAAYESPPCTGCCSVGLSLVGEGFLAVDVDPEHHG